MAESNDSVTFLVVIICAISIAGYVWWNEKGGREEVMGPINVFLSLPWAYIGIITLSLVIFTFIALKIRKTHELERERKDDFEKKKVKEREKLVELSEMDFSSLSSQKIEDKLNKLKDDHDFFYRYATKETKEKLNQFFENIEKNILPKKVKEEEYKEKRRKEIEEQKKKDEEKKRQWEERLIKELTEFKIKNKSPGLLPLNKDYPSRVILDVKINARIHLEKIQEQKLIQEKALEFYREHSLDTVPDFKSYLEKETWLAVNEKIKRGEIKLEKQVKLEYRGKKLPKEFYRAEKLEDDQKKKAIAQGFQHVRVNELDGHVRGGGFYIKNKNKRENKYHFVTKYLLRELHPNIYVEKTVDGRRVDAVLLFEGFKLGLEIETGVNKEGYLAEKIKWLDKNFDQWIFVCPKRLHKKYFKLVDNDKSFCKTPKETKNYIEKMLSSAGEPISDR
jgi:hypothetical protein